MAQLTDDDLRTLFAFRHSTLTALALTSALALSGCLETDTGGEGSDKKVDEEDQAIDASLFAIRDYCDALRDSHRPRRPRPAPSAGQLRSAERAVERLLTIVRRRNDAPYEEQHEWRSSLAGLSSKLEDRDCLPEQVTRIDRFLRRMPLPEPVVEEEYVPEEDYEPSYR